MLTIRLFRVGRKNQPAFKIIVTDKRKSSTRGRFVEEVGIWNPLTKQRNLKGDRVKYWISVGAKPSATVHNMLVADKVIEGSKISQHKRSKKPAESRPEAGNQAGPPSAQSPKDIAAGPPKSESFDEQSGETSLNGEPEKPAEPAPEAPADVSSEASAKEEEPKPEAEAPAEEKKE